MTLPLAVISVSQSHYVRVTPYCSATEQGTPTAFYYSVDYSFTFSPTDITTTSFVMATGFSPGVSFDVSIDGGLTYIITGATSENQLVSGLSSGTTYQVVRRMHSINGVMQVLPAVPVTTL